MAGQGRNADGLTGSNPSDAANVVRFPGDWFGPLTDLVPIDTGAAAEPDAQDLYADEPHGAAADSFWSEDAQDVHRVATPAQAGHRVRVRAGEVHGVGAPSPNSQGLRTESRLSPFLRRSRGMRLAVPIGSFAALAAASVIAVTGVLGSGAQPVKPEIGSQIGHGRAAGSELAAAPRAKASSRTTRSAKQKPRVHKRSSRVAPARHKAAHRAPASAVTRPRTATDETVASTTVAANTSTGDVASPTGVVSPPPNATQLTP